MGSHRSFLLSNQIGVASLYFFFVETLVKWIMQILSLSSTKNLDFMGEAWVSW
jgi:hypothetical protein